MKEKIHGLIVVCPDTPEIESTVQEHIIQLKQHLDDLFSGMEDGPETVLVCEVVG